MIRSIRSMAEILIILILLLINGFFAMCEIALVSSRIAVLEHAAGNGNSGARAAIRLLKKPEHFLSTVQIGITLVGIISGAYAGVAFSEDIRPVFAQIPFLIPYADELAFFTVVAIITYCSVLIGELVPKSIAITHAEKIAIRFAGTMEIMTKMAYPIVVFLGHSTNTILRILHIPRGGRPSLTEEELQHMIAAGARHGIIEKQEKDIMQNVFVFGDLTAKDMMIPKKNIVALNSSANRTEILHIVHKSQYSKFPVCDGNRKKLIGYITIKDLLKKQRGTFQLANIIRTATHIQPDTPALELLRLFRHKRVQIAFVMENNMLVGLLTLHDLIENVMGEFPDIGDKG